MKIIACLTVSHELTILFLFILQRYSESYIIENYMLKSIISITLGFDGLCLIYLFF